MDLGLNLATSADSWKVVKRAEELGYARAWFYDTQLLNADVFVAMGAAAVQTSRIRLATGVLIPSNRIAPVAASALASLNALAPGRIDFGVSTGFTARRTMGLGPVTLDSMREYIRVVQGLLAGDTLEWTFEAKRRKIRFLNPELDVINIRDPIPLHISALGPRGRRLTAELGAGWLFAAGHMGAAKAAIADMQRAWRAAGVDRPAGWRPRSPAAACCETEKPSTARAPARRPGRTPRSRSTTWSRSPSSATWGARCRRRSPRCSSATARSTRPTSRRTPAISPTTAGTSCSSGRRNTRCAPRT
jgi:alkanesulfonate monooxygenase SsuD/methylene tetrahydromethanopterin reductase-like flavin-dependent oxidoreductase (luciferase family)